MSGRKVGLLLLILAFGATVETAWNVRGDVRLGPEGCRVMSGRFYGPSYSFEQTDERRVAAAPRLEVRNAFGDVRVSAGATGLVKVKLRKVVYLAAEDKARSFAGGVELRLSGDGQPLRIGTNRDEVDRREAVGFETHLEIEAPADAVVAVRNEHGRVDLSGVSAADVTSSFEGVTIEGVAGDVKLESRNGDVTVRGVGGTLDLSSRHGGVEASSLARPAKLDVQHGDLNVRDAAALEIAQQFGGVTAERVAGDLVVRAGHSEVHGSDVRGRADVETTFSGVHLARVGGSVRAKAEHGLVNAEDVAGGVVAQSSFDGVELERVGGPAEVEVQHGHVTLKGLAQGARVRASGGDVQLEGFTGAVDVELERGNAQLSPRAAIGAPVSVSVTHGEAHLEIPTGSRVEIEAESRRGDVEVENVEGFARTEGDRSEHGPGHHVKGSTAAGGSLVRLRADGDVGVKGSSAEKIADEPIAAPTRAGAQDAPAPRPVEATPTPVVPAKPAAKAKPAAARAEEAPEAKPQSEPTP